VGRSCVSLAEFHRDPPFGLRRRRAVTTERRTGWKAGGADTVLKVNRERPAGGRPTAAYSVLAEGIFGSSICLCRREKTMQLFSIWSQMARQWLYISQLCSGIGCGLGDFGRPCPERSGHRPRSVAQRPASAESLCSSGRAPSRPHTC